MVAAAAPRVERVGLEDHSDRPGRVRQVAVAGSADGGVPTVGRRQVQQDLHGGRLPGAVGPQEPGDAPGSDGEAQIVDDDVMTVASW